MSVLGKFISLFQVRLSRYPADYNCIAFFLVRQEIFRLKLHFIIDKFRFYVFYFMYTYIGFGFFFQEFFHCIVVGRSNLDGIVNLLLNHMHM